MIIINNRYLLGDMMIKKCILDSTPIFKIEVDNLPELSEDKFDYYNNLAQEMSNEMGVLKELLFVAPHFFFINHWHKLDGKWYFYKGDGCEFHFVNELLGEVISEYFGLDTVHYKVAFLQIAGKEPEYGLVSENFCSPDYLYTRTWDYNLGRGDIFDLNRITAICNSKEEARYLISDMKKFFIRDFYTSQGDRSGNNFLFKQRKDGSEGKRLAPLYDYENSFESINPEIYANQILYLNMKNPELPKFFKKDYEYQELLGKIRDADMKGFIKTVEERHEILIPSDLKEYYKKSDIEKKEIIKTNRLVKVLKPKDVKSSDN